ncbi:hypothetical protein KIN20_005461 [Parelaphostrongylus tenuis]|nr:hypothetical protein KIN20_005461 [Parelaphostrongylus tenuis]
MVDEVRLRSIVANSIVVPVYEEAPQREDQQCQLTIKSLDTDLSNSVANIVAQNEERIEVIDLTDDNDSEQINMVNESSSPDEAPFLEESVSIENEIIDEVEMFVPEEGQYRKVGIFRNIDDASDIAIVDESAVHDDRHVTKGTQMIDMDDNETTTYYYDTDENGEAVLVDRSPYDFENSDANSIYIEEVPPSNLKSSTDLRMRSAKQRHIDVIVNKVACRTDGRPRRQLTVYECEECGRIIRYPSKIKEHRRTHSGLKPFECVHCGQRFSQKGGLTCHMRLHTGERPYACTWDCGKSFHSNSALKMHERTHNGERPYSCAFCGKLFSKRSHSKRHELAVHPREIAHRAAQASGLAAAGPDEDRLREVVNGVIEEVRIERSLRNELRLELS